MADALRSGAGQVCPRQVVEVVLAHEGPRAFVVEVEERLEAAELVRAPRVGDRCEAHADAVPPGEGEHQLGLERPLEVDVELDLRESAQKRVNALARDVGAHGGV